MIGLSKKVSRAVVNEIALALGESIAAQAVGVTGSRLKMLAAGKGQLSDSELKQIHAATGKTWRTWMLEIVKRAGVSHHILSPTLELVNSLNDAEADGAKTPRRSKKPRTSQVV